MRWKRNHPEPQNATKSSGSHRATPKEKSQKNLEVKMGGSTQKIVLDEKMKANDGKTASPKTTASDGSVLTELSKVLGEAEAKQAEKLKGNTASPKTTAKAKQDAPVRSWGESVKQVTKAIGDSLSTAARKQ